MDMTRALGSRLSALGSRLSALGSRLSALGSLISVCIGSGVQRSPTTLDMPASCTAGHGPLALAGAVSSLAPGPSPRGCAATPGSITAAARPASSVSANTASVCCDCFIGRVPRWNRPWVQCKSTGNYTKCTLTCEKYFRISCHFRVPVIISVVHRPGLRPLSLRRAPVPGLHRPSLRRATCARTGANRARHRAPRRRPDDDTPPIRRGAGCRLAQERDGWLTVGVTPAAGATRC